MYVHRRHGLVLLIEIKPGISFFLVCDGEGVILYILLSGKVPFYGKTDEDILKMTLKGRYNIDKEPWPHISDEAKECVELMLTFDPAKRPDAKQILGTFL